MAILFEIDPSILEQWLEDKPEAIRAAVKTHPPNKLYSFQGKDRCTIQAYQESGNVTVAITGEFNKLLFGKMVFDVPLSYLTECDLPAPNEELGEMLKTPEEVMAYINSVKSGEAMDKLIDEVFTSKGISDDEKH